MSNMVNVGFGNMVVIERIVTVAVPDSAPSKRIVAKAKSLDMLIDATHGRRTRALVILDSGHIVLSSLQPQTISDRVDRECEFVIEQVVESHE